MAQCVSVRIPQQFRMALVSLSLLSLLLVGFQLGSGAPATESAPVFVSGQAANSVLQRHKRHNTGLLEEFLRDNLERECIEEVCGWEEAREVFENDEKTMEFWVAYADGNQCDSSPCLNQGSCTDHTGYYTCTCLSGFTGRNCEIVVVKRCDVNNGGCMHFCNLLGTSGTKCSCATGYKLMEDGASCKPETEFPCGRTAIAVVGVRSRRSLLGHKNAGNHSTTSLNNITNTSTPASTPAISSPATYNSVTRQSPKKLPLWFYNEAENPTEDPTVDPTDDPSEDPTYDPNEDPYEEQPHPYKRIVGGTVVIPGEIPWQVALIARPSGHLFCGGSILSRRWVITAAHCLVEAHGPLFLRVGEHNVHVNESTEKDYEVLKQHIHPLYNASINRYNHDIALLHTKSPIAFSKTVRPICIGPKAFTEALVKQSSPATVSGWGRTRFLGSTADRLQKVEVPFTDRTECKHSSSARITPVMFCAGYHNVAKDACQGDSGGPHANVIHDTWFLTGIVSWGEECAKDGKYGVYTRVSLYYQWINNIMGLAKHQLPFTVEDPDP